MVNFDVSPDQVPHDRLVSLFRLNVSGNRQPQRARGQGLRGEVMPGYIDRVYFARPD